MVVTLNVHGQDQFEKVRRDRMIKFEQKMRQRQEE